MAEDSNTGNDFESTRTVNYVGISKSKRMALVLLLLVVGVISYYTFFSDSKKETENKTENKTENIDQLLQTAQPVAQETSPKIVISPQLPELPPLIKPKIMPRIPIEKPKTLEKEPSVTPEEIKLKTPTVLNELPRLPNSLPTPENVAQILPNPNISNTYNREKRNSSMIAFSAGNSGDKNTKESTVSQELSVTSAKSEKATKLQGRLDMVVAQGKIIDAALETAINSDLDGLMRAVITRDVYAESGNTVMIPKGSRIIGNYSLVNKPGMYRINVNWNRLILPNGVDINLSSQGTDELGRNGITGFVDHKIQNILTSAISLAGLSFGTAVTISKIPGMNQTQTTTTDGDKTTSTTNLPFDIVSKAVKDLSDTIKNIIEKNININPTVHIDQGTLMKVFVNQDLIFTQEALTGLSIIK